jgi:hypothetical protein
MTVDVLASEGEREWAMAAGICVECCDAWYAGSRYLR